MRRPSHLPMAKLAYQDPRFMESLGARPLRILAEYLDPLGPSAARKSGGHHRDVRLGAHPFARTS